MLTVTSGRLPPRAGGKMSPSRRPSHPACNRLAWHWHGFAATRNALATRPRGPLRR